MRDAGRLRGRNDLMQTVIIVIHLMLVLGMIGVVLLQRSEGGGLGMGSGGGGGFMSSRGTANLLTRTTAILAVGFFITSLALSWIAGLERKNGPTALVFTRQGLPQQARTPEQLVAMRKGGYVLIDCNGPPEAIVIATGSEVSVAAPAVRELQAAGKRVRLVSMPCCEVFDAQPAPYRESVLPSSVTRRVAVEAVADQNYDATFRANARQIVKCFDRSCRGVEDRGLLIRRCEKLKR